MTGLQVPLTPDEKRMLWESADRNMRHPRDEARWILTKALRLISDAQSQRKDDSNVMVGKPAAAVSR